jgi:hypothetical protein
VCRVGASAPHSPGSRPSLPVVRHNVKWGQIFTFTLPSSHSVYRHAYTLFAMDSLGGWGLPCAASASDALERGLLMSTCRFYAIFSTYDSKLHFELPSNSATTNWHQPGVCLSTIFSAPFMWWEAWGLVLLKHNSHLGIPGPGFWLLPLVWGCVHLPGICACMAPVGVSLLALCTWRFPQWWGGKAARV